MIAEQKSRGVEGFLLDLQAAIQDSRFYGPKHALTEAAAVRVRTSLHEAMAGRTEIVIGVIGGELAFGNKPLYDLTRHMSGLIAALEEHKVEKLTFMGEVPLADIRSFIELLTCRSGEVTVAAGELGSITISGIGLEASPSGSVLSAGTVEETYREGPRLLGDIGRALHDGLPVNTRAANTFIQKVMKGFLGNKAPFLIATSLKKHDEYSFVHSINVAVLSLAQGEALGLPKSALADLGLAGFLHDSGKIALAADILRKKGKLSESEYEKVSQHPLDGAKLLLQTPDLSPLVPTVSFEHHLRYDGRGYPRKVFGTELCLASMIVSISDVYDALRSRRPYRGGLAPELAFKEMIKEGGGLFHPSLLGVFFRAIGIYPPGSLVFLDDGSVGIVIAPNPADIRRPVVEIWYAPSGETLKVPQVVNLTEKKPGRNEYLHMIVRSVPPDAGHKIPARYRID